jgi:hypothetical protein
MFNRHNFEIAELAPQEEGRLVFCGIYVTPAGTCETDGHQAVIVSDQNTEQPNLFGDIEGVVPAEHFTPFILDRESALKISKAIPKKASNDAAKYAVVDATSENNENAMVSVNDVFRQEILRARKISGTFPDLSRVMPAPEKALVTMSVNPELLGNVLKVAQKFCKGHGSPSVTLRFYPAGNPIRIDVQGDGQSFTAVVMPMRADDGEAKAPEPGEVEQDETACSISDGEGRVLFEGTVGNLGRAADALKGINEAEWELVSRLGYSPKVSALSHIAAERPELAGIIEVIKAARAEKKG